MRTKIPIPLNLPKDKKIRFDNVPFVNTMTQYSLKILVKRMWEQLMALANVMDEKRDDLPTVLDRIMSGETWCEKDIHERYQYGFQEKLTIRYDTLKREFLFLDEHQNPLTENIKAISITEGKELAKEQRKAE